MNNTASRVSFDHLFPPLYAAAYAAIGLAVHLLFFPIGDLGVETDWYGELALGAQKLAAGEFSVTNYPYKGPFYSFALQPVHLVVRLLGGDWYLSGVVLNLLCASASLILIYRLLLWLFNRPVAVWGTVLTSLVYELFLHAHKGSSDMLFLLLFTAAVYVLVKPPWTAGRLIGAGLLSGLAFLTRYNGLILPAGALVMLVAVNPGRLGLRRRLGLFAIYMAAFLAMIAPWYLANVIETGKLLATHNLQNIFVVEFYGETYADRMPPEGLTSFWQIVTHDPWHFLKVLGANVVGHLWRDRIDLLGPGLFALFLLGLLRLLITPPTRRQWSFLVFPICYFLAMCTVYHQPRFRFPLIVAYTAIGAAFLFGTGSERRSRLGQDLEQRLAGAWQRLQRLLDRPAGPRVTVRWLLVAAVLAGLIGYQAWSIVRAERYYYAQRPLFVLDAARFLKSYAIENGLHSVMARKPHLAYYSGLKHEPYPQALGTAAEFLGDAASRNVDVIAYSAIEHRYYPSVHYLGYLDKMAGVEKIYQTDRTVLYELTDRAAAGGFADANIAELTDRLAAARQANDLARMAAIWRDLAAEHLINQDYHEAARICTEALGSLQSHDPSEFVPDLCQLKIDLYLAYLQLRRYGEGIELIETDLPALQSICPQDQLATIHALLARHLKETGRPAAARQNLEIARDIYLAIGDEQRAATMSEAIEGLQGGR